MNWKSVDKVLEKIIGNKKVPIKDRMEELWNNMEESKMASIENFTNNELILKVSNSSFLQIISMKRENIIKKFNKHLKLNIKKIKIRLGGL